MNDAASILVIILSVTLCIFLIFAIVLIFALIKVINQLKELADETKSTVKSIKDTSGNIARFTSPVFVGKFVLDIFNRFRKKE